MVGRMLEIEVDPPYMQRREAVTGPQQYGGCGRTGTRIQASWLLVQCSPPIPVTLPLICIGCQPVPPIAQRPRAKGCIGKVVPLSGDLELGIVATFIAERGGVERSKSSSPTPPTYHQVLPPPYTHIIEVPALARILHSFVYGVFYAFPLVCLHTLAYESF